MPVVVNPIPIGFDWSQTLIFSEDAFETGDRLRVDFRERLDGPVLFSVSSAPADGIDLSLTSEGYEATFELTEAHTRKIPFPSSGRTERIITGDLGRVPADGDEQHWRLRLHIRACWPATERPRTCAPSRPSSSAPQVAAPAG